MPDLTDPTIVRETTPARWFDIISNGVDDQAMPPFGEASSNPLRQIDRWNLVFFLYTLSASPAQIFSTNSSKSWARRKARRSSRRG